MKSKSIIHGNAATMPAFAQTVDAQALVRLGMLSFWDVVVLGRAPLPDRPIRLKEWLIVPADQDATVLPKRTYKRVQAIYAAGIRPKGFVVVHEAPRQLPPPPPVARAPQPGPQAMPQTVRNKGDEVTGNLDLSSIGRFAAKTVATLATAAAAIGLALPAALLAGLVLLDPILIAVTEDDVWVEIDRWYE